MTYLVDDTKFSLSYSELLADYGRFVEMDDADFVKPETLLEAVHFACVVGYLKETGTTPLLSDQGVIHELIHLALGQNTRTLRDIREQFARVLKLCP